MRSVTKVAAMVCCFALAGGAAMAEDVVHVSNVCAPAPGVLFCAYDGGDTIQLVPYSAIYLPRGKSGKLTCSSWAHMSDQKECKIHAIELTPLAEALGVHLTEAALAEISALSGMTGALWNALKALGGNLVDPHGPEKELCTFAKHHEGNWHDGQHVVWDDGGIQHRSECTD